MTAHGNPTAGTKRSEETAAEGIRTAAALVAPFAEMAQKGMEAFVAWQKFTLDFAAQQNARFIETQKSMLDEAVRQSSAASGPVRQFIGFAQNSSAAFADSIRHWACSLMDVQRTFFEMTVQQSEMAVRTVQEAASASIGEVDQTAENWERVQMRWIELKDRVRERWDRLTDDELTAIEGKRDKLAGKIAERYETAREEAERQLDDFARRFAAEPAERWRTAGGS